MRPLYPRSQRCLEIAAIAAFAPLAAWNLVRLSDGAGAMIAATLLAWLATDLLSGLVHWALDRFGNVDTPLIGRGFIRPFREHHANARAMTRHDFAETNGSSALGALPLLACAAALDPRASSFLHAFVTFTALGVLAANQCHKWAHMARPPRLVRLAQRLRLILPPESHRRHHAPPHASHFCTANGWLNAPLDAILGPRR